VPVTELKILGERVFARERIFANFSLRVESATVTIIVTEAGQRRSNYKAGSQGSIQPENSAESTALL
jgi:hypothetical protein